MSRVFAAPRSRSWAEKRHVTTNAIQEVQWLSRLSKHIIPMVKKNREKKKKNTKQNKSGPRHEACLYIKTESPNAYNDT